LSPDDANLTSDNETEYEEEEDDNNDDNIAEKKEEIIEPVVVEVVLTPEEIEKIEQERKKERRRRKNTKNTKRKSIEISSTFKIGFGKCGIGKTYQRRNNMGFIRAQIIKYFILNFLLFFV